MQLEVGTILEGKVSGITKFGAFVTLPGAGSGLVHISEVANAYVSDIGEYLSVGQTVKVKVISITPEGKLNLSIKKAQENPATQSAGGQSPARRRENRPTAPAADINDDSVRFYQPRKSDDKSFEDKLKQFMQESDSKMSGNRLYEQQKRGGRRRK